MSIEQLTEENINENATEVAVEEVVAESNEVVEEATVAKAPTKDAQEHSKRSHICRNGQGDSSDTQCCNQEAF